MYNTTHSFIPGPHFELTMGVFVLCANAFSSVNWRLSSFMQWLSVINVMRRKAQKGQGSRRFVVEWRALKTAFYPWGHERMFKASIAGKFSFNKSHVFLWTAESSFIQAPFEQIRSGDLWHYFYIQIMCQFCSPVSYIFFDGLGGN